MSTRYTPITKTPVDNFFLKNQKTELFDFLLYTLLFVDEKQQQDDFQILYQTFFHKNPPTSKNEKHEISYNSDKVQDFLTTLEDSMKVGNGFGLINSNNYEKLWNQLADKELATVYITVLLGRLLLMEDSFLKVIPNIGNYEINLKEGSDLKKVVTILKFGTLRFDEFHPVLKLRRNLTKVREETDLHKEQEFINESYKSFLNYAPYEEPSTTQIPPNLILERVSILKSLIFVTMFFQYDNNNASLLTLLQTWFDIRSKEFQAKSSPDQRKGICPGMLRQLLLFSVDYNIIKKTDNVFPLATNPSDPFAAVDYYLFFKLIQIVRKMPSEKPIDSLYDIVVLKQAPIINVMKFIIFFIPFLVIKKSNNSIKQLIQEISKYFMEPKPIGNVARECLLLLKKTIMFHGIENRNRLLNCVDIIKNGNKVTFNRREITVLLNPHAQRASLFTDRIDFTHPEDDVDIIHAQANLLLNIYEDEEKKLDPEFLDIPAKILSKYFYRAHEIIETSTTSKDPIEPMLSTLKKAILKEGKNTDGDKVVREENPSLPLIKINVVKMSTEDESYHSDKEKRVKKIFPKSVYVDKIIEIIEEKEKANKSDEIKVDIGIAGGSGTLQRLCHSMILIKKMNKFSKPISYRIYTIPIGTNNFLTNNIKYYDPFFNRYLNAALLNSLPIVPSLETTQKIRSEIVQLGQDTTSNNNSRSSFVFTPVCTYTPGISEVTIVGPFKHFTPHLFNRQLLNNYFVNASKKLPAHIYTAQCLCHQVIENPAEPGTFKKGGKVINYVSLSFCQRLNIGIIPEAIKYQRENKLNGQCVSKIIEDKNFKFNGINLQVSYVPMDPNGGIIPSCEIREKPTTYYNISIKSTSTKGDPGPLVGAHMPWLEVFTDDMNMRKRRTKLRELDYGNKHHVGSIIVDSPNATMFSVLMDGELYGPFHKIIISKGIVKSFNIMTFAEPMIE